MTTDLAAPATARTVLPYRDRQRKAARASWRAWWLLLVPAVPAGAAAYWWTSGDRLMAGLAGVTTGTLALVLGPVVLAFSVSALRRGTRWTVLSVLTGFLAGFTTVGLILAVVGATLGYGLLTGNPVPFLPGLDVQDLLFGGDLPVPPPIPQPGDVVPLPALQP